MTESKKFYITSDRIDNMSVKYDESDIDEFYYEEEIKKKPSRTLEQVLPCVIKKLREGREWRIIDLCEECRSSESTVRRLIKGLQEAGLVTWENRRVRWNEAEVERGYRIKHSRKLISNILKGTPKYEKLLENKYFLQHLETGYPELYEAYKELRELQRNTYKKICEFREFVKKLVKNSGFEVVNHRDNAKGRKVYETITELPLKLLRDRESVEIFVPHGTSEVVCSGYGYIISSDPEMKGEIEALIKKIIENEEIQRIYTDIEGMKQEEEKLRQHLRRELEKLVQRVEHLRPLEGKCDLCRE